MDKNSVLRIFSRYASTCVLGSIGISCYILADTFFVSRALGASGLAALNLAIPIYNFIYGFNIMIGMGGAAQFSMCKARGDEHEANRIFTNSMLLTGIISAFFMIIGVFFSIELTILMGADADIIEMTDTYIKWLLLLSPSFAFKDVLLCFTRNDGAPSLCMASMLLNSLLNVFLDYLFMYPLGMGIFGAVFATCLSPILGTVILLIHVFRGNNTFHFTKTKLDPLIIKKQLSIGFPSLITQFSSAIVMIVFNTIILSIAGNIGLAAYGIVANISLVVTAVYTGIADGSQPLISTFFAQNDKRNLTYVLKYAILSSTVISAAIYVIILILADPIALIFNSGNDPILQKIAVSGLRIYFISCVFAGFNIVICTYLAATEQAVKSHIISLMRGLILIIPLAYSLSAVFGMYGVWLTCTTAEMITAVIGAAVFIRRRKKQKN